MAGGADTLPCCRKTLIPRSILTILMVVAASKGVGVWKGQGKE
jgi:hypothetical protein